MALSMAIKGDNKLIKNIIGKEDVVSRLHELGFIPGEKVKVLGHNGSGLILMVKGVKVALDRGLAARIIVAD